MADLPDSLFLSYRLLAHYVQYNDSLYHKAAAELRRLHAENQSLRAALAQADPVQSNTVLQTFSDIDKGIYTNASFSHANVVMVSKDHYASLLDSAVMQQQAAPVQQSNKNLAQRLRAKGYEAEVAGSAVENIKESGNG